MNTQKLNDGTKLNTKSPLLKRYLFQALIAGGVIAILLIFFVILFLKPNLEKKQNIILTENKNLRLEMNTKKNQNENRLNEISKKHELVKTDNEKLKLRNQSSQNKLGESHKNINNLKEQLRTKTDQLSHLSSKLLQTQNERDEISAQIKEISENNKYLKTEIERLSTKKSPPVQQQQPEYKEPILETQNISGSSITIHYTKDRMEDVTAIKETLSNLGAKIKLNHLKGKKYEKKSGYLYYYPGSSSIKTAKQIKAVIAPLYTIEIVESNFWWVFKNRYRLNLWLTTK